jgi:hypothetical protein
MIHFDSVEQAEAHAEQLEADNKAIQWAIDNKAFDDVYTEKIMKQQLKSNNADLDELWPLINSLKLPLL